MSTWSAEVIEADGNLFAYVRIQNDYTGNISGNFRRIYTDKNGKSYFKADGRNQYIDVRPYLDRRDAIAKALKFYRDYNGRFMN